MGPFADRLPEQVDFLEVAPENWINVGGRFGKQFRELTERYPLSAHGLSLSIGSPAPLDEHFLGQLKRFLDEHGVGSDLAEDKLVLNAFPKNAPNSCSNFGRECLYKDICMTITNPDKFEMPPEGFYARPWDPVDEGKLKTLIGETEAHDHNPEEV